MASSLEGLYQQVILDHAKQKHGHGLREATGEAGLVRTGESRQYNPLCGDEVTLRVSLAGESVADVSWDGEGCSISQAATSVMADLVIGQAVTRALETHEAFVELMHGRGKVEPDEEILEDGIAFAGVAKFPARIKCALLSWMAFKDATAQVITKEDT
jgi:nitrogen fixation protein NifU and related proteins